MLAILLLLNAFFMTAVAGTTLAFQSYKWWRFTVLFCPVVAALTLYFLSEPPPGWGSPTRHAAVA